MAAPTAVSSFAHLNSTAAARPPEPAHVVELDRTIDLAALHRVAPERYPFLLQSTTTPGRLSRFDILFACPGDALVAGSDGNFLQQLDDAWYSERLPPEDVGGLPFIGGWFV